MKNNRLDKNIKEIFDGFQPEIDTDSVWENIEPKLKKKKKNRFFFFWLLLGAGFLFWFFGLKNQNQIPKTTSEVIENQSVTAKNTLDIPKETVDAPIEIVTETEEIVESSTASINSKAVTTMATKRRNSEWYAQTFERYDEPFSNNQNILLGDEHISKTNNTAPSSTPTNIKIEEEILISKTKKSTQSKEVNQENPTEHLKSNKKSIDDSVVDKKAMAESSSKKKSTNKKSKNKKSKKKKKKKKRKRIARVQNSKWRPYLQLFGAPEYNLRSLKYNGEGTSQLRNQRKETESQLLSFSLGGNFQIVHKNGFVFFAGMELRNIDEKFQQTTRTERQGLENGIISYTVNSVGDTIDVAYGLKLKKTVTETTETEYNNLIFLNVPIGFGYGKIGRQYGWKILGGFNYNLGYEINAKYLDASGNLRRYDNKPSDLFKKSFKPRADLNLWTSAEFFRKINGNIHWMIAPKIEVPTRGLTDLEVYPLSQRYYNFSLKTGFNILLAKAPKKKKSKRRKKRKS